MLSSNRLVGYCLSLPSSNLALTSQLLVARNSLILPLKGHFFIQFQVGATMVETCTVGQQCEAHRMGLRNRPSLKRREQQEGRSLADNKHCYL